MSLRFHQSVGLVGPDGRPVSSAPEMRISPSRSLSKEEDRGRAGSLYRGITLGEGAFIPTLQGGGPRPAAGPSARDLEESQGRMRITALPKWLDGHYRPKGLTPMGREFLESLSPELVVVSGGVTPLQEKAWISLEERMGYLQRKYMALDLVRKGLAVEADGQFWPRVLEREAQMAAIRALERRRDMGDEGSPMGPDEALVWLAAYREAAWDQIRALHPQDAKKVDALMQALMDQGLVDERRVKMGLGSLGTLRLTPRGFDAFKVLPGSEEFLRRGFGPRKTGRGIGELHEQAVGDGIGYFGHEVQSLGGVVTGITLDPGLRREYLGSKHYPDLRVEYEIEGHGAQWDIEVMGTHRNEYGHKSVASKTAGATMRAFDPLGRSSAGRKRDVRVTR